MPALDPHVWQRLLLLAIAGALGTLARYGLGGLVQRIAPASFPWGTFAVNALGCLMFGIVWSLAEERALISGRTRIILLIGFMGAFTTFSTFAFETGQLLADSQWLLVAGNMLLQNAVGIGLLLAGIALGKLV
ncbi:MAG: CrcB family protein [Pirellulales bacterium]